LEDHFYDFSFVSVELSVKLWQERKKYPVYNGGPDIYMETDYTGEEGRWSVIYYFAADKFNRRMFLIFPFMLMHEFVSHIFTIDQGIYNSKIDSPAFLEGWLVWGIWHFYNNKELNNRWGFNSGIRFWDDRLKEFTLMVMPRFLHTAEQVDKKKVGCDWIMMGGDSAQWFEEVFGWNKYMEVTEELICYPSRFEEMDQRKQHFQPNPNNLHTNMIENIYALKCISEDINNTNVPMLRKVTQNFSGITEWWNWINDYLNSFE
jgi:hypothetical protein